MHYQFAKERPDYSDLASGRVFYSLPGHPAFPIRLADEILQRCLARREASHVTGPCILYDPVVGQRIISVRWLTYIGILSVRS